MNEVSTVQNKELSIRTAISEFRQHLANASASIIEACKVYVKALDSFPEAKEEFIHEFPSVSVSGWKRYEMIGRGQILPEIAANPIKFSDKVIENFSISDQKKLVSEQIEVLTLSGDQIRIPYALMDDNCKRIVFAKDHIRSLPEQRAFIEKERSARIKEASKPPVDTVNGIREECMRLLLDKKITSVTLLSVRKLLRGE